MEWYSAAVEFIEFIEFVEFIEFLEYLMAASYHPHPHPLSMRERGVASATG